MERLRILAIALVSVLAIAGWWYFRERFLGHSQTISTSQAELPSVTKNESSRTSEENSSSTKPIAASNSKEMSQKAKIAMENLLAVARLKVDQLDSKTEKELETKILEAIKQLLDLGKESHPVIHEFLKAHEDIRLDADMIGSFFITQSLRLILLEEFCERFDSTNPAIGLEVVENTSSALELAVVARNLEKYSPTTYRSKILQSTSKILAGVSNEYNALENIILTAETVEQVTENYNDLHDKLYDHHSDDNTGSLFVIVAYYQAHEMFPLVEDLLKKDPKKTELWLEALSYFPGEDQANMLQRLLSDKNLRNNIADMGSSMPFLDYQNNRQRQIVTELFTKKMSSRQKAQLIEHLQDCAPLPTGYPFQLDFFMPKSFDVSGEKNCVEGVLKLFNELEPQLNPRLRWRLEETRSHLQKYLEDPSIPHQRPLPIPVH